MNIALWIVQVLLAVLFLAAGVMKAFQYEQVKERMAWAKDVSKGTVTFIGIAEILGAVGLILPALFGIATWLVPTAALGLAVIMVLAAAFHAQRRENQSIVINVVLLVLAAFVAYGRWFSVPL